MFAIIDKVKRVVASIVYADSKPLSREQLIKKHFPKVDIQESALVSLDSKIGDYTYVGVNTTITKSVIGRYCSIANNVSIGDGEHDLYKVSTSSHFYKNPYEELTVGICNIGNDVWIGTKSVIRRGVNIGNGAVIGANSFVNKDVPDFAIVAGTPARIIKYRFSAEVISEFNNSAWWELDMEHAREEIKKIRYVLKNQNVDS